MIAVQEQFRAALRVRGIIPPAQIAVGSMERADVDGPHGKNDASYIYFADGFPAGGFENHRDGLGWETWRADIGRRLTPAEQETHQVRIEVAKRERATQQEVERAKARERATTIWTGARPAEDSYPYLTRKGVKAHGLRLHNGGLVVPLRDAAGELHSLQIIAEDGTKRYLTGGRVGGCHFTIGDPGRCMCIAEGYATAASIHEATGFAVAVAFDCGNLCAVAEALKAKHPEATLVLCADDDYCMNDNPGLTAAREAATAVGGLVASPDFGADRPDGATDFNDLATHKGPEAVKRAIANAKRPEATRAQPVRNNAPNGRLAGRITYRRATDIRAKPIRWLWPRRFARGKVSMIAGDPGLGKSQVMASIAAIVSTGGTWPVDRTRCEPGAVVFLSAEDNPEDTLRPRLDAAGADLSRVCIVDAVEDGVRLGQEQGLRGFDLSKDVARLGAMLDEIGDVGLVVIDPITAYLGDTDSHRNSEMRALLAPLSDLAAKYGAAIVCVSHLNKSGGGEAMKRVSGSGAFVAAPRAAFLVAKDSKDSARRLLLPMKNNIGNDRTGLAFGILPATIEGDIGPIETSRVEWEGQLVTITADEVVAAANQSEEPTALDDAEEFLGDLLSGGAIPSKQISVEAREAGIAWRTIQRAKTSMGIQTRKVGMDAGWVWELAATDAPKNAKLREERHTNDVAAFGDLGALREPEAEGADIREVEI